MESYSCFGEINQQRGKRDADEILQRIEAEYRLHGKVTKIDGLSVEFDNWRFNLRKSNTEPVIRLNVEARHFGVFVL